MKNQHHTAPAVTTTTKVTTAEGLNSWDRCTANVSDHRAATSDSAIEKRPGFAAPVHRIVIQLTDATTLRSSLGLPTLAFMALIAVRFSNWIWVQELQQREMSSFY